MAKVPGFAKAVAGRWDDSGFVCERG